MDAARVVLEVVAGIVPGQPMSEHSKRFVLTSNEWDGGSETGHARQLEIYGAAMIYALSLQDPGLVNWVRLEWLWL